MLSGLFRPTGIRMVCTHLPVKEWVVPECRYRNGLFPHTGVEMDCIEVLLYSLLQQRKMIHYLTRNWRPTLPHKKLKAIWDLPVDAFHQNNLPLLRIRVKSPPPPKREAVLVEKLCELSTVIFLWYETAQNNLKSLELVWLHDRVWCRYD
jgi:hypothetical protein